MYTNPLLPGNTFFKNHDKMLTSNNTYICTHILIKDVFGIAEALLKPLNPKVRFSSKYCMLK